MSSSPFTEPSLKDLGLQVTGPAPAGWNSIAIPELPPPPNSFTVDDLLSTLQKFEATLRPMRQRTEELESHGDLTAKWYRAQLGGFISHQRDFLLQIPGVSALRILCGAFWGEDLTLETVRRIKGRLHIDCGLSAEEADGLQVSDAARRLRILPSDADVVKIGSAVNTGKRDRAEEPAPAHFSRSADLPKPIEQLLAEATTAYASKRSRVWLVAFPTGLKIQAGIDLLRSESSDNCGKILDGAVHLPARCITPLGHVNLSDTGQSVTFVIDAADTGLEEFHSFARRAGAALVAYPPAWLKYSGNTDPATMWAIALTFVSPSAKRAYPEWKNECRIIAEPWAASCAALRDWTAEPATTEKTPRTVPQANRHGPDFRSVVWNGQPYSFTGAQAAIVAVLWGAFENGTPDVSDESLIRTAGSDAKRLREIFKSGKTLHSAWDSMIVEGATRGTHRLRPLSA